MSEIYIIYKYIMSTLYKFRVYCQDEEQYIETWSTSQPIVCPNNNIHTINQNSWTILQEISEKIVEIKEERIPTGGNYKYYGREIDIPSGSPGDITNINYVWDYPVSILNGVLTVNTENLGDKISVVAAPDTIIGNATSDINIGDTVITVNQTVLDNLYLGYLISLLDSTNGTINELGEIININKINNTITVNKATTDAFLAANLIYVRMSVIRIDKACLAYPGRFDIGENRIGGTYLSTGLVFQLKYQNNNGQAKKFATAVELLY